MSKSKNKVLSIVLAVLIAAAALPNIIYAANQDAVTITESGGWFESAYVEWTGSGLGSTNVYWKKSGSGDYTQIDPELIREYPDHMRADIPGLSAGEYIVKVVPVANGVEDERSAAETDVLSVMAYTREGFAFSEQSPAKDASGGYNPDGTPKQNADITYISQGNVNRVMIDQTPEYGLGLVGIFEYRERNKITTPLIVRIIGRVDMPEGMEKYLLGIRYTQNVTIEGIGEDAAIHGFGITLKESRNIELRNFAIMWYGGGTDSDAVALDTNNDNVWIHNLDFFYGAHGPDDDQSKGDGSIDMKNQSDYVTISYCHFWDSGKTSFTDSPSTESSKTHVTYHHNWFDHSDSRHPRCVGSDVHLYNNYYDGVSKYGIGAAKGSSIYAENNYFRYCERPMIISKQGSDIYKDGTYKGSGTLSGQAGGMIKGYGNVIDDCVRFVTQLDTPDDTPGISDEGQFDCYIVSSPGEKVPDTVKALNGGAVYSNFDTADTMYSYQADSVKDGTDKVKKFAGRMDGGDFEYVFDNAVEDTNYDVIPELQSAVENYSPAVVDAGGDASFAIEQPPEESENRIIHNFTTQGTDSDFYDISGSLTDLFGAMRYDAANLTQALKFEGNASIKFTPEHSGMMTVVANFYRGSVNLTVNGETINGDPATGLVTFPVLQGVEYTITRASVSYLYYLALEYEQYDPSATTDPNATAKPTATPKPTPYVPVGSELTHNFTTQGTDSDFFSITGGGLKTNKVSIEYGGEVLTRCYEIGSSALISFTAPKDGSITFVFAPGEKAEFKLDGSKVTGDTSTGLLTIDVKANETYEITKSSVAYLYYITAVFEEDAEESPIPEATPTASPTASPVETPSATAVPSNTPLPIPEVTPSAAPVSAWSVSDIENSMITVTAPDGTAAGEVNYIYAAKYTDDGILADIEIFSLVTEADKPQYIFELSRITDNENVRIMLWDSDMQPLI